MINLRKKSALVVWLALLAAGIWILLYAKIHTDLTGFLPAAPDRAQQLLLNQLREGPASRLILIGIEGDKPERLAKISHSLATALRNDRHMSFVHNGSMDALDAERKVLFRYRYLLSPAVTSEHFNAPALKASLQASAQLLASQGGALAKPLIPSDPTGEIARVFSLWTPARQVSMHDGAWFAADESRALMLAQTHASGMDVNQQQEAIDAIRRHFDEAVKNTGVGADRPRLLLSGPGVFAAESRRTIETDSWRLSVIAAVLVWVVLWFAYRSVPLTLFAFIPVASGLLIGTAAVVLVFGGVHGITLAFGATLIGEAVDYPNYAFLHTARGEPLRNALQRIGPTLRLAILTTVFSSVAMLFSSFSGLAQLGLLSLVGMAAAGLVTQFVLPELGSAKMNDRKIERLPFLVSPGNRWRIAILPLLCLSAGLLYLQRDDIWDDDLASMSPLPAQAKKLDQELRGQLGAPDVRYLLMTEGSDREQALRNSELLLPELKRLVQDRVIGGFDMAAHYLPSQALQLERQAALPSNAMLARSLKQAMVGLPFRDGAFKPFLIDVANTRQQSLLQIDDLRGSSIGMKVQSLLLEDRQGTVALITLNEVRDAQRLRQVIARLAARGVVGIDLKDDTSRLISRYRDETLRLALLGTGLIGLLLLVMLRSARQTCKVLYPVIAGAVMCAAATVLLGEKLTLFHVVALLLVIGVGLNYALFFSRRESTENEEQRNYLSLATCGLTTILSFGTLMASGIPVLHAIGQTVALGSLLCLICAYLLADPAEGREE